MKQIILLLFFIVSAIFKVSAQDTAHSSIKFYLDEETILLNNAALPDRAKTRIFRKFSQLINQTGIAEIGYSTFFISPKMEVLKVSEDQAGIDKIFLAECEITLLVKRTSFENTEGGAVFNSFSKQIFGSGSTKDEAIANALNSLSAKDKQIVEFFVETKKKIAGYYTAHCPDILKEADRFLQFKKYEESIALYFSVPSDAPCYTDAYNASKKVYAVYVKDKCEKQLIRLKTFVTLAQTENSSSKNYYDSVLNIMNALSPSSDKCYEEAKAQLEKIDKRLNAEQKARWEFIKKYYADDTEISKEMYKAMGRISSNYQHGSSSTNVIIAH
jgi:hypothetical protein